MNTVLHCDCGFETSAQDEEGLVAEVQRHAREAHGMRLSRDEALLLAFQAELSEEAGALVSREQTGSLEEGREEK